MKVTYRGDSRFYEKYKIGGRYHVKCLATKEEEGVTLICTYQNRREDKHKADLNKGKLHECKFVRPTEPSNSILRYYLPEKKKR